MTTRHSPFWPFYFFLALCLVFLAICARVLISGYSDLSTARQALEARLIETAIDFYDRASRWYLPLIGAHKEARAEMARLCRDLEATGKAKEALRCFRRLRGTIMATRWLVIPDSDLLEESNLAIARLSEAERGPDGRPLLDAKTHLELLERDESPDPWLSGLAIILFFCWLGGTSYGLWTSIAPSGAINWSRLGRFILLSVLLLIAWLVTLRFA